MLLAKLKTNWPLLALLLIFLLGGYFIFSATAYFDPLSWCRIKIEKDILSGNRTTIKQAIRLIKSQRPVDYQDLCKYVEVISEKRCTVADPNVDLAQAQAGWQEPGCYVRGSKYIYLAPESSASQVVIRQRAEAIIKYSQFSQDFWTGR